MIKLKVVDQVMDHFVVFADEPVRIEVSLVGGVIMAEVYKGARVDREQEPIGSYDGSIIANTNWKV